MSLKSTGKDALSFPRQDERDIVLHKLSLQRVAFAVLLISKNASYVGPDNFERFRHCGHWPRLAL